MQEHRFSILCPHLQKIAFSLSFCIPLCLPFCHTFYAPTSVKPIQYNTFILLFHLILYETFTKYFHKHVQHKYKE